MRQKKLMLLGGIRYLLPVIETAHRMGIYVITADYLPNNIAHRYSDEYVNVSIMDREAVLKVAREKHIDGILSFGVDPGVVTAAYVADKMGLASPPFASVEILQNKDKFRDFLAANGFNCPWHLSLDLGRAGAPRTPEIPSYPCIVKPVDSAGSKGCTRVNSAAELSLAIDEARSESHNSRIIIEQFLELKGHQTGSDSFSIDNDLVFCTFDSQYFDASAANPYTPAAPTSLRPTSPSSLPPPPLSTYFLLSRDFSPDPSSARSPTLLILSSATSSRPSTYRLSSSTPFHFAVENFDRKCNPSMYSPKDSQL